MDNSKSTSRVRLITVILLAMAMIASSVLGVLATSSISKRDKIPTVVIDSGFDGNWEGLISVEVETDKYDSKETKKLVDAVNGGDDKHVSEYIKDLPKNKEKSDPENFPTTNGYNVNLKLYDRITDFYDIRYHKDYHNSNVMPGKVKLEIPGCEGMKGSDLMVLIINEKTGEMYLVPPISFNSKDSIMEFNLPCTGPYCILHKIPIVVRNVDPDLYPNRELAAIIEEMPHNEVIECSDFIKRTTGEEVSKLEVADGVKVDPEDYNSVIPISDVAVHLGENQFSYDLSTKFDANLFRGNDKVDWERILKYSKVDYDKEAILKNDKELTEIEPIKLEDCFLYHIDAVTQEVSIINEPEVCWETYGNLMAEKEDKIQDDEIIYFDVDDIENQKDVDAKLKLNGDEDQKEETSSLEFVPEVYAADVNLDAEDPYANQTFDEDDVCLVINGEGYIGMGPFLLFMPKHAKSFPWWILLIIAALIAGGIYYKKKKDKKEAEVTE